MIARTVHSGTELLTVLTIVMLLIGCSEQKTLQTHDVQPAPHMPVISPQQFFDDPASWNGRTVTIRGYLGPGINWLPVFPSRDAGEAYEVHNAVVWAFVGTEDPDLDERGLWTGHRCTDSHVELTGLVGPFVHLGPLRITEIVSIRSFDNEAFEGDGDFCYDIEEGWIPHRQEMREHSSAATTSLTPADFIVDPQAFDGNTITLRGYLVVLADWLAIFQDQTSSETSALIDGVVIGIETVNELNLAQGIGLTTYSVLRAVWS